MGEYEGWPYEDLARESNRKGLAPQKRKMLHRELKKHSSGLPLFALCPNLPLWCAIVSLLLVTASAVLHGIHR